MNQLKTLLSKFRPFNQPNHHEIMMVIQATSITLQNHRLDNTASIPFYQQTHPIETSIQETIYNALETYKKTIKNQTKKIPVNVLVDDNYLFIHRIVLSDQQMNRMVFNIKLDISDLNEYEWQYERTPKEMKDRQTILVYALKKGVLKQLETAVQQAGYTPRRMISRSQAFGSLITQRQLNIQETGIHIIVDIGEKRIRIYIIQDTVNRLYRQFNLNKDPDAPHHFDTIKEPLFNFVGSCIESYKIKHPNQPLVGIYFHSDTYQVPSDIRLEAIKQIPCFELGICSQNQEDQTASRYSDIEAFIESNQLVFESNTCVVIIHLGIDFHALYIIQDNQVSSLRKFNIDVAKNGTQFSDIFQPLQSFSNTFIEAYTEKTNNPHLDAIYIHSDTIQVPKNIQQYSIKGIPIQELAIETDEGRTKLSDRSPVKTGILLTGLRWFCKSNHSFNLIPLMKRFELFMIKLLVGVTVTIMVYIFVWTGIHRHNLMNNINTLSTVQSRLEQVELSKKKQNIAKLEATAKKYQSLIDIIDKLNAITDRTLPISDVLLKLSNIETTNITIKNMSIRRDKVILNGISESGSSSDEFFKFIQELQAIEYLDNIKYNIKYGAKSGTIDFTVNLFWVIND